MHGFSAHCLRFKSDVAVTHARLVSGWLLAFTGREPNPLDRYERFQTVTFVVLPSQALPVASWSHARRKFWEAAAAKNAVAREALVRIGRFFELEETWKSKPPSEIFRLRLAHLRPHLEAFFSWAQDQYALVQHQRGSLRSAFGYAVRQKDALTRVLEDGRLVLENNRSERELRRIANGRKVWLFVGSDDHAESAGHLFTLIASARLHGLEPETYLRDLFRVLAHWPKDRYLELAPKFWSATRARLDPTRLALEIGPLTIPPPPSEEQPPAR